MDDNELTLRYSGKIDNGMDAIVLADSLVGFSNYLRRVAAEVYGEKIRFSTNVKRLREGSVEIDVIQLLLSDEGKLIIAAAMEDHPRFLNLISDTFSLFKHLKGEQPRDVTNVDHGSVNVENNHGEVLVVNIETLNVVTDEKTGAFVERFIKSPLSKYRVANEVEIRTGSKVIANSNDADATYFTKIGKTEENILKSVSETRLLVISPDLEGAGKWRLSDGTTQIWVAIEDEQFLRNVVDNGTERFGHGDILYVRLRSEQTRTGQKLTTNHFVEEVMKHEVPEPPKQSNLFDSEG